MGKPNEKEKEYRYEYPFSKAQKLDRFMIEYLHCKKL